MNHGNHGSNHTPVDMAQYNGSYNNMIPSAGLDINNLHTINMNLGSFTPNMQHQASGSGSQNMSQSQQMQMFLQQQQQLLNSNNANISNMEESELINHNQQYNRMMQMSNHPNQNQMQYGQ